ncbi:hypothetical protein TTHNP4_00447 (plasmid) [Thermus thermophilus]|uniref:TTHB210-like domain-containing protein n=1 Tax=Thermus thermophilus TaxID=274 RepID=A0A3P4AWY1_THETH|nr:hypothetical protein TTHNP4_00447 [Thermus thermophilus]
MVSLAVALGLGLAQMLQVRKAPPSVPYVNVSEALKGALPNFIPGLGTLYVDPSTLPEGPFLAYDRAGNLVKVVFMVPLKKLNESHKYVDIGTKTLRALGITRIDHVIPFYANSFVLGHQWNRVCRLRVSGSWARTRHRSATASIISSRSRKYRLATASFTKGHTRSTGCSSGL